MSVPAPFFVKVLVVAELPPVTVRLPAPPTVRAKLPARLANVVVFVTEGAKKLLLVRMVAPAESVVAPKVTPVAPLFTVLPAVRFRTEEPKASGPKVYTTPEPAVSRSATIRAAPDTEVARPKFRAVSLASCRTPPVSARLPAPSAPAEVVARRMPVLSVRAPLKVLLPERTSVPGPDLVSEAVVPEMMPPRMTCEFTVAIRVTEEPSVTAPFRVRTPLSVRSPRVTSPPSVSALVNV